PHKSVGMEKVAGKCGIRDTQHHAIEEAVIDRDPRVRDGTTAFRVAWTRLVRNVWTAKSSPGWIDFKGKRILAMDQSKLGIRRCLKMWMVAAVAVFAGGETVRAGVLELRKGDHICLVGNALGERMQFMNEWETLLYRRFPQHELVVRNLCFPAD